MSNEAAKTTSNNPFDIFIVSSISPPLHGKGNGIPSLPLLLYLLFPSDFFFSCRGLLSLCFG